MGKQVPWIKAKDTQREYSQLSPSEIPLVISNARTVVRTLPCRTKLIIAA
jgi:hypothetical protein